MNSNTTSHHQAMMNSNIISHYQTMPTSNITSQPSILLHITKLCQPFSGLNGLTFSLETCGGVASTQSFLKPLLRRRPHRHTGNSSPCSSVPLLCYVHPAPFVPLQTLHHKWDSRLKLFTLFKLFTSYEIWKQSFPSQNWKNMYSHQLQYKNI